MPRPDGFQGTSEDEKVAPLVRQIAWTHNLLIFSRCKRPERRER